MTAPFRTLIAPLIAISLIAGCQTPPDNGITQIATIDSLLVGVYDGHVSLHQLRTYGDFGIGTFEGLDGEMLLLDGRFYQVRSDGKVYRPALSVKTPFACVTSFVPDCRDALQGPLDLDGLEAKIDKLVPQPNQFCAFIVRGDFTHVKTRSVPAQKKPYPPLAEVTKTQPVFEIPKVRGTLIGFRSPALVKGVNVPGYHLHFLADDLSSGGHVLAFELAQGTLEADTLHDWLRIYLPTASKAFGSADLSQDRSTELRSVEKGR